MVCWPVWYMGNGVPSVSCQLCLSSRRGCSFKKGAFGIGTWPTIVASQASRERRAEGAAAKRKGTPQVSKEDVPITETRGSISSSTTRVRKPARPRSAPLEPLSIAGPSTMPVGPTMATASTPVEGRAYGVFIEPLDPYLTVISDRTVNGMRLDNLLVGLQAIRD